VDHLRSHLWHGLGFRVSVSNSALTGFPVTETNAISSAGKGALEINFYNERCCLDCNSG
jgi:hypothetical protein